MSISVLDLFSIGIGPSSSHAIGPMRAARRFLDTIEQTGTLDLVESVVVTLYGALALTGKGHGTDRAVVMGLAGELPDEVDPDDVGHRFDDVSATGELRLDQRHPIAFTPSQDIVFDRERTLPRHPNALQFTARDRSGTVLLDAVYYSVGGGFVVGEDESLEGATE